MAGVEDKEEDGGWVDWCVVLVEGIKRGCRADVDVDTRRCVDEGASYPR